MAEVKQRDKINHIFCKHLMQNISNKFNSFCKHALHYIAYTIFPFAKTLCITFDILCIIRGVECVGIYQWL